MIRNMSNLERVGIRVLSYDFMPVFDWTRTDLADNSEALRHYEDLQELIWEPRPIDRARSG